MKDLQSTIDRIKKMEQLLDEIDEINKTNPEKITNDAEIQKKIQVLENYLDSGQWMKDYECDERGELPAGFKRGVLSEDALYNLLIDVKWRHEYQEKSSEVLENKEKQYRDLL